MAVAKTKKAEEAPKLNIRTLLASEIECRVGNIRKDGCSLLLYKDARVDMRLLDEVYGPNNWQRKHELINGNLFCTLSVWDEDKKDWVSKQDVGTESYTEKEKGQASDAFKRAGFNWGIGRELYTAPFIWIKLEDKEAFEKNGKFATNTKFAVKEIGYNNQREIDKLVIVDNKGRVRYTFGKTSDNVNIQPDDKKADESQSAPQSQRPESMYTGSQLTQAVSEMRAVKDRKEMAVVWAKYPNMQNSPEFRNACQDKGKQFPR